MQTILRAANSTKERQTFSLAFYGEEFDKCMVVLGCSSIGLNEMVSLLLKGDPTLSCVPGACVALALMVVEFGFLAWQTVSPALLSPSPCSTACCWISKLNGLMKHPVNVENSDR